MHDPRAFSVLLLAALPMSSIAAPSSNAAAIEVLNRTSAAFNDIAQKATPAVVSISVVKSPEARDLFQGVFPGPDSDSRSFGIGSGVFIRANGYILTNNHVVEHAEKVTVTLDEKHKLPAEVIGTDPKTDLAVIRLLGGREDFPTLSFGDSSKIKVGDWAVAIGSPFGLNRSVSSGIISAKGRARMGILDTEDFIQTDAAINPGSSGGPLLNLQGEVIGINTAIFSQGSGFVGIGFAIPARIAKEVADQLILHGRVIRGWVGISAQDLDADLAGYFHVSDPEGALVSDVAPGGPGARASLRPGDVITKFDGRKVVSAAELKAQVSESKSGSTIPIDVVREGQPLQVRLRIAQQPVDNPKRHQQAGRAGGAHPKRSDRGWGIIVEDVPKELAGLLGFDSPRSASGALIVGVEPGSPAFDAGLSPGDVILRMNHSQIPDARSFAALARQQSNKDALLYVQRGSEEKIFVPLKPGA
ncbi:MAG: Do family serine endopeptidase [Oligoflexia bacterium]|nr:Do family serine endopeptidase [Oligoflexia bacterium]